MRLPNFIVIGVPKSGTTSLYFYLKQHPDVFLPVRKELHYFSYDLLKENLNGPGDREVLAWLCPNWQDYISHYDSVRNETRIGEISPSYFYYSQISERIRAKLGPVKIIALLRNPIEKAFSQFMHLVREGRETLTFYQALIAEERRIEGAWSDIWRYKESSLYASRLNKFIDVFDRSNVKVILSEEFFADPIMVIGDLFSFMGIPPDVRIDTSHIYNRTGRPRSKLLAGFLTKPNVLRSMVRMVVPEQTRMFWRLKITELNTSQKEQIDQKSKSYLEEYFYKDIVEVERIIGRQTNWLW